MKQLLTLFFVLAALFIGGCDFLGEDRGNGGGEDGGGQDQGVVVVED